MENITNKIGKRFKLLLEKKHMTHKMAATLLNVDERTIRRWIKDGIDRLSILENIGEKLEVDVIETFFK